MSLLPLRSTRMVGQQFAAEIGLVQTVGLDHGAHGPVQDQDAVGGQAGEESGSSACVSAFRLDQDP